MTLIDCRVEPKLKWTKYCVLSAAGADNVNNNDPNNVIFIIKSKRWSRYRYFLKPNFVEVNRLCFVYSNQDADSKRFKTRKYYSRKGIIKNYNMIINRRNFYNQPINSAIEQYKEIRTLITGQGEDYTTGFLLDYGYIKHHYRLIAVDLSRQKE